jgi:glycosyltransferase involved in cell wall biosynthesis
LEQSVRSELLLCTSTPSQYLEKISIQYGIPLRVTAPGQGIAHDWNFGLQCASTRYVTLAHQDDIYLPTYTAACLAAAGRHPDTLIAFPDYIELVDGLDRSGTLMLRIKKLMRFTAMPFTDNVRASFRKKSVIAFGSPIPAPGVMYNLDRLSGFRFSNDFSINMDWDAWARMADMNGRFVHVKQVLMKHRIHPESATSEGLKHNLRQAEDLRMFMRFWPAPVARVIAWLYAGSYRSNRHRA